MHYLYDTLISELVIFNNTIILKLLSYKICNYQICLIFKLHFYIFNIFDYI